MLGKAFLQREFFNTESVYTSRLKADSFYRFLADHRHEIFRDDDYVSLYCANNGRNSVPPSLCATACLLQSYDRVSDEEAVQRATFDVRWAVALGTELTSQPFAKSTLQEFRAKLILNDKALAIFQRSLAFARDKGYLKNRALRIAMDTTHILGKGAVKDTYNLLADGIKKLYRRLQQFNVAGVAEKFQAAFERYLGKSFKGEAQIDWNDQTARQQLLTALAADARALLEFTQAALTDQTDQEQGQKIRGDASLLMSLLLQDLETTAAGQVQIKNGVAKDRIVSTTDPEMRHGRKSSNRRFDGHKAALATETDSQLITAVAVIAGNAHDSEAATLLVDASAANTGNQVVTALGDCAFGTAEVREQFETRSTELVAKVPQSPQRAHFTKHDFTIDLHHNVVTCPAGQTTSTFQKITVRFGKNQEQRTTKRFVFAETVCAACPLRAPCISSKAGGGKSIQLHPREDLLQQARAAAKTETFKEHYRHRVVVEHSIARLVQRGIRQSRYNSRRRTLWQVALAAAVVNLMVIAGQERRTAPQKTAFVILLSRWIAHLNAIDALPPWQRLAPLVAAGLLNRRSVKNRRF